MNKFLYRFIQCMIGLGLAIYLAEKWTNGKLMFYINPRYTLLTLIGIVGLVIMSVIGLNSLFNEKQSPIEYQRQSETQRNKPNIVIFFLIPIITAFIGLSASIIWPMYFFLFIIGYSRVPHLQRDNEEKPHYSEIPWKALLLLAVPFLLGVFVPARPLSSSSLSTRGMSLSAPFSIEQQKVSSMDVIQDEKTILDWIKVFNYATDETFYLKKSVNVIGFVYHDPRLLSDQFMISRFVITCCAADAFAIGMAVHWPESANLVDNSWVNVKGTFDVLTIDGEKVPLIRAQSVDPIEAPELPYLYP